MAPDPSSGDRMYRRLQVPPEASAQQIRRSYRRLAHQMHPDTHPDDPEASRRFQEITEAYEILGSPERRATYDRAHRPPAPPTRPDQAHSVVAEGTGWSAAPGWAATNRPTVIGVSPVAVGSAPLIAGPVRVTRPGGEADDPSTSANRDLMRLIHTIWSWEQW